MNSRNDHNFDLATLRVIDAAINRAAEGLRVVEDYARMILDDAHLTERLKGLRHRVAQATLPFNSLERMASRDTQHDVGTSISVSSEFQRESTSGIIQANMARVQQSLRTIEEYAKLARPEIARNLEPLRYESYALEKAILTTVLSLSHLQSARLYVLVDGQPSPEAFRAMIASLIDAGVNMFQLRDKDLSVRQLALRAKILNELCRPHDVRWIFNDRADLCMAFNADGVHLGQDDLSVYAARRIVGPAKLIGLSTHSIEQARAAVVDGANYIGVGPIFHSKTKAFKDFVGPELARQVAQEIKLPAFAIGGITPDNLDEVLQTGIGRVAIRGAIVDAFDRVEIAREFRSRLEAQPAPTESP